MFALFLRKWCEHCQCAYLQRIGRHKRMCIANFMSRAHLHTIWMVWTNWWLFSRYRVFIFIELFTILAPCLAYENNHAAGKVCMAPPILTP